MQDRPTYDELLAAIESFLEDDVAPNLAGSRGFHARVSANTVRIIRRELAAEEEHLAAEWAGLDEILGAEPAPPDRAGLRDAIRRRNSRLCELIRSGELDDGERAALVRRHVQQTVRNKISVTNPGLLDRG